jgi:hypothetical protein
MYRWGGELGVLLTWMWWNTSLFFRGPACPSSSILSLSLSLLYIIYYLFYLFGVYSLVSCGSDVVHMLVVCVCVCVRINIKGRREEKENRWEGGPSSTWWRARAARCQPVN